MSVDCGCGGGCPICSSNSQLLFGEHAFEIDRAVAREKLLGPLNDSESKAKEEGEAKKEKH